MLGGMGMRLKYSNPMYIDDVAVDFPEIKIILAHPSFHTHLDRPAVDELTATLHHSALAQGTLPPAAMDTLTTATGSCETAITRHLAS
jgi:hypothetical protein